MNPEIETGIVDAAHPRGMYLVGAISALIVLVGTLADIAITMIGMSLLLVYIAGATIWPASASVLMAAAMPGGILMIAWNVMIARKLLQLRGGMAGDRSAGCPPAPIGIDPL